MGHSNLVELVCELQLRTGKTWRATKVSASGPQTHQRLLRTPREGWCQPRVGGGRTVAGLTNQASRAATGRAELRVKPHC